MFIKDRRKFEQEAANTNVFQKDVRKFAEQQAPEVKIEEPKVVAEEIKPESTSNKIIYTGGDIKILRVPDYSKSTEFANTFKALMDDNTNKAKV